jgi:hypothetical protein
MGRNVFISYSRTDVAQVETLATDIETLGHQTWVDRELTGGQRWWDRILDSIDECDTFVLAMSQASLESRASNSEYDYAKALGKPILPVLVRGDFGDSLMPPELAELQRVDYADGTRRALAILSRSLNELPPAVPLPETMPERPAVPASYLFDLKTVIEAPEPMSGEAQEKVLAELNARLLDGHQPKDVRFLVRRLRRRDDVLVRVERELAVLETRLDEAIGPDAPAEAEAPAPEAEHVPISRTAPPPPISTPAPAPTQTTAAPSPAQQPVAAPAAAVTTPVGAKIAWFWWAVAIFFGLLGGAVAYFVNREKDPKMARNLFIAGGVASVVWAILLSGG